MSTCSKPLSGSASRGRSGKHYPAYHCSRRGHYFRVSKANLEAHIDKFFANITLSKDLVIKLVEATRLAYSKHQTSRKTQINDLEAQIKLVGEEIEAVVSKIKFLNNQTAITYMEADLDKLEVKTKKLKAQKEQLGAEEVPQFDVIELRLKKLLEHFDQIVNHQMCSTKKAQIFSLFFKKLPTYKDLEVGTAFETIPPLLNPVISALNPKTSCLASARVKKPH